MMSSGPDVIPLHISGSSDVDMTRLSSNDMMKWAIANLWQEGKEGGYAVRHGNQPVRDIPPQINDIERDDWSFFERAFPTLFPYGVGGIENTRPVPLDFREHIQWALQYHDRRFRTHETFSFVAFGILQRRQALGSARLEMKRSNFDRDAHILSTITLEDLRTAQAQEEHHQPLSNPAVKLLYSHVHAASARVMGTDASRYRHRSQLFSTALIKYLPVIWVTINFSDLHDPVAQIFAGHEIDMDQFSSAFGPNSTERAETIASDPYASACFFHFMLQLVLRTLYGFHVTAYRVSTETGILGSLSAYYGMVESQGRGTLHCHLLFWMKDTPSAARIHELLDTEQFRAQVRHYIRVCFHAHIPGVETRDDLRHIPNEVEIAYSRPPNPDQPNFKEQVQDLEHRVARAKQVHTCSLGQCLVPDSHGQLKCRRRAPWPCSPTEYIDQYGNWSPERHFGFLNCWNPFLSCAARCNNDQQLLTNGRDTTDIGYYSTKYMSKAQGRGHQMSALVANQYAYDAQHTVYADSLREQQRLLLFRLVNKVNSQQELGAPMVISYLMGWGDCYTSHTYTAIYWGTFVGYLLQIFPDLGRY